MTDIIEANGLNKELDGYIILDDVSFSFERRGGHGILSPKGGGKTALLDVIACASSYDEQKGTLVVGCGIDNSAYEEALSEILLQLEEIKNGNITDEEINAAKEALESDCREAEDHPIDYENFGRVGRLFGGPSNIEEYRRGIVSVTLEDISAAARKLTLDTVYFLKGELCGEDGDIFE